MNYFLHFLKPINKKYPFPPLVWFMIFEMALSRGSFFLAMPFIAIKMSAMPNTNPMEIGAVLGIGPLIGAIAGFYVGHLSDIFGRRAIIFWSLILWSFVFTGFAFASTVTEYSILMIFNGLARAAFEPVSTAFVSDLCQAKDPSGEMQKSAFHLRYFSINIGAAVAPIIGAQFVVANPKMGFFLATLGYLISAIFFQFFSKKFGMKIMEKARARAEHTFRDVLKVLRKDRLLQMYLIAYFFLGLSFSQVDSILALYLKQLFENTGIDLFGKIIAMNGIVVVLFTLPILKWTKAYNLNKSCAASALVLGFGYLIFGFATTPGHFYIANFFISIGEIIVFANGSLIIESLAPSKMKGAYLGTNNLSYAGVVIGPLIGGTIMYYGGGSLVFYIMAALMVLVAFIYLSAFKRKR